MKSIILSLLLVFLSSVSIAHESAPAVTAEDSQVITDYLNNICGDTWCEGEYELSFYNVVAVEQADQIKYYVNFSAVNSYEPNDIQKMVACEIHSPEFIEIVVSDLRTNKYASEAVMVLDSEVDRCIDESFYQK